MGPPLSFASGAVIAEPTHVYGQAFASEGARGAANRPDRHAVSGQTLHVAAVAAHEVRMLLIMTAPARNQLEAPDVVTHVGPPGKSALGEIDQVTIERCAVETAASESIHDLRVRHGRLRCSQLPQHS